MMLCCCCELAYDATDEAVYVHMQEAGMRVIEINPGDNSKGATIKALVGEAMQSCSLQGQCSLQVCWCYLWHLQ